MNGYPKIFILWKVLENSKHANHFQTTYLHKFQRRRDWSHYYKLIRRKFLKFRKFRISNERFHKISKYSKISRNSPKIQNSNLDTPKYSFRLKIYCKRTSISLKFLKESITRKYIRKMLRTLGPMRKFLKNSEYVKTFQKISMYKYSRTESQ